MRYSGASLHRVPIISEHVNVASFLQQVKVKLKKKEPHNKVLKMYRSPEHERNYVLVLITKCNLFGRMFV